MADPIRSDDWQHVIARCLAELRGGEPGGNEFYEASEIGSALAAAGYRIIRPSGSIFARAIVVADTPDLDWEQP